MPTYIKGEPVANATLYELYKKSSGNYNKLAENTEINFEVSTLDLSAGYHTLVVKAKADGYEDSDYSNEIVYEHIADITVPLASFMDLVGTTSGSMNMNTNTNTPVHNTSTNWRYAKVSLADYDIKRLTLVTGTSGNGVAPVIFTSSADVTAETVVDKRYGASHQYITSEHMALLDGEIAVPDGATYMIINELLKYSAAAGEANADALAALCQVTYRVKA